MIAFVGWSLVGVVAAWEIVLTARCWRRDRAATADARREAPNR